MRPHTTLAISLCAIAIFAICALYQQFGSIRWNPSTMMGLVALSSIYSTALAGLITAVFYALRHKLYHTNSLELGSPWIFDGARALLYTAPASIAGFIAAEWFDTQFKNHTPAWIIFLSTGLLGAVAYSARHITRRTITA